MPKMQLQRPLSAGPREQNHPKNAGDDANAGGPRNTTACMYCRHSKMRCRRDSPDKPCKRCEAAKIECVTRPRMSGRRNKAKSPSPASNQPSTKPPDNNPFSLSKPQLSSSYSADFTDTIQGQQDSYQVANSQTTSHGQSMDSQPAQNHYQQPPQPQQHQKQQQSPSSRPIPPNVGGMPPYHSNNTGPPVLVPQNLSPSLSSVTSDRLQLSPENHPFLPHSRSSHLNPPILNSVSRDQPFPGSINATTHGEDEFSLSSRNRRTVGGTTTPAYTTTSPLEMLASVGLRRQKHHPSSQPLSDDASPGSFASGRSLPVSSSSRQLFQNTSIPRLTPIDPAHYFSPLTSPQSFYYPDMDPIYLGYMSPKEAQATFNFYWEHLDPVLVLLDARLHTLEYLRKISTFLFTAVCFNSAKFMPDCAALAQRLGKHVQSLISRTLEQGGASLETCQAFCLICPWLDPDEHVSFDQTSTYIAIAITKLQELQRRVMPAQHSARDQDSCVPFEDPAYKRSFERTFLTLYTYDRGLTLTTERPSMLKEEGIVKTVEDWVVQPGASKSDKNLASLTCIRRDLGALLDTIREQKNSHMTTAPNITRAMVNDFLSNWRSKWARLDFEEAYMNLVSQHSVLSILVAALKAHSGNADTESQMLQQCLVAAVNTCRTALNEANSTLQYIPNNTCVMLSYAATLAIKLSNRFNSGSNMESSIFNLIQRVAELLDNIGTRPAHRQGRAAIYGLRLRSLLQETAASKSHTPQPLEGTAANENTESTENPEIPGTNLVNGSSSMTDGFMAGLNSSPKFNMTNMSDTEFSALLDNSLSQMDWRTSLTEPEISNLFHYSELLGDPEPIPYPQL